MYNGYYNAKNIHTSCPYLDFYSILLFFVLIYICIYFYYIFIRYKDIHIYLIFIYKKYRQNIRFKMNIKTNTKIDMQKCSLMLIF